MKLIQQGAEAKIYLTKENNILKSRLPKSYRHPTLDKFLIIRRTRRETKILQKAHILKINVPTIIHADSQNIQMKYIEGDRLSQTLNSYGKAKQNNTMQKLGKQVAKLHENNIIHADLTTSNVILRTQGKPKIFLIDFGLSYISTKTEDKAVDLHLIKQALLAKHHQNHEQLFTAFCKGYKNKDSTAILERLETVEQRGRYKRSK